ncbi:hypothetical protein BKA70DRAFT_1445694 [Coprinopsis sp. MPI-PUGE-AT-0042]|nr:hypothetical protein BKA70DRAFT_1445694 [Coprinopsis sp. MPI-PUGE-AT-0042]
MTDTVINAMDDTTRPDNAIEEPHPEHVVVLVKAECPEREAAPEGCTDLNLVASVQQRVLKNKRMDKQLRSLQVQLRDAILSREQAHAQTLNLRRCLRALSDVIKDACRLSVEAITSEDVAVRKRLQAMLYEEFEDINVYRVEDDDFIPFANGA